MLTLNESEEKERRVKPQKPRRRKKKKTRRRRRGMSDLLRGLTCESHWNAYPCTQQQQ
ncbi:hypothetical protein BHE74_00059648 [Ensete ventricosum]|uniref:Uncharacterized protein n=1 Tax=Ensete ventricosum TaxID=4639 RepID=A0A444CZG7_ENSVE|nr:hypothetical protein B296_00039715 [Ensete ventricosum]RWV91265.1 hypothetical protein GW17_00046456 [Ensete ventricosum]RWW35429.1 hypothetical protein BHE74_00059648 [Ensete ventricosum]RZS27685.1 hypothetical protein BHM03_00061200 [Ensete ventricosum]